MGVSMGRKRQDVTDAELAILEVLWEQGSATIRDLTRATYPRGGDSEYATVKKLLARLEEKGYVRRDRHSMAHVFRACKSRAELIGRRLQAVADHLCGGSQTPLLMHLLRTQRLTVKERQELHALLEELVEENARRKGRRK